MDWNDFLQIIFTSDIFKDLLPLCMPGKLAITLIRQSQGLSTVSTSTFHSGTQCSFKIETSLIVNSDR